MADERQVRELTDAVGRSDAASELLAIAGRALRFEDDPALARALLDQALVLRRPDSVAAVALALAGRAEIDLRTGDWDAAVARSSEAIEVARAAGGGGVLREALLVSALISAGRGRVEACRASLAVAWALPRLAAGGAGLEPDGVLGFLELGLRRIPDAIRVLEPLVERELRAARGGLARWTADLVEAYAHAGQVERATGVVRAFEARTAGGGTAWVAAAAARCRGLLASDAAFAAEFERALAWHDRVVGPFERARTELAFGERLRRARRRREAVARLRSALVAFERLGATLWAERTRLELTGSGALKSEGQPVAFATEPLTAQEIAVARAVATGATNREVAAALFLSPRTIEFHLGNVYAKLGLRSRTQLAIWVSTEGR